MDAAAQRDKRIGGTAARAPQGRPLGSTAKSSTTCTSAAEKRAQRYAGLGTARSWLLQRAHALAPNKIAGDVYRTCDCRYARRERRVGVQYSAEHQGAHYSGLVNCGSVWACPLCTAVIQQRRRGELTQLIDWAYKKQGLAPAMVTLTFPHCRFDRLDDLLERQAEAFKKFRSGNVWALFKRRSGFRGLVRSLELTHGRNGWHPHTHELWLIRRMDEDEQRAFLVFLRERWLKCCIAAGLVDPADDVKCRAFLRHAVDVRHEVKDSEYLAKQDRSRAWGADREVVTGSAKAARAGGVHPHEFLIRQDKGDRARFLEYVDAMKGRRQLYWSPGLKQACGVEDKSDEQLADESREPAELLGELSADDWAIIRAKGKRAQVLEVAEMGNWNLVIRYIISIGCDPYGMRDPSTDPPPD